MGNVIISYQGIADIAKSKDAPEENYHLKSLFVTLPHNDNIQTDWDD